MSDISQYLRQQKVTALCFSKDGKYVAVGIKATGVIEIFEVPQDIKQLNDWKLIWRLKDQGIAISAIDWTADNKILSASVDRSVLVYRLNEGTWTKDLTLVACDRAVVDGQWSNNGQKFVVSTSCMRVFVGYYESDFNWWQSAKMSVNRSTVLQARWHPSGKVVGVCSSDYTIQVITAVVQDTKENYEDASYSGVYANVSTFGEVLFKIANTQGWVNSLAFSPDGTQLVFTVQTGLVQLLTISEEKIESDGPERQLYVPALPFLTAQFVSNDTVIVGGHDRKPGFISTAGGKVQWNGWNPNCISVIGAVSKSAIQAKSSLFEKKGVTQDDKFAHQSAITQVQVAPNGTLVTSDTNGVVNFWKL